MGAAILARDKDGVLSVFKLQGSPMFSLWENQRAPTFSCAEETDRERLEMLEKYLDIIKASGTSADYMIKFHDEVSKSGKINNNTPVFGSLSFRVNDEAGRSIPGGPVGASGNIDFLKELFATKLQMIEDKWERKLEDVNREHEQELEEIEQETAGRKINKHLGFIGVIGDAGEQYPWMQDIIKEGMNFVKEMAKDAFTVARHKMNNHRPQAEPAIGNIPDDAGAAPDVRMRQALERLINYNVKRFGWPQGTTAAQIDQATPEEKEAAHKHGFTVFSGTMVKLCDLINDDDIYDLAIKKLKQL